MLLDPTCGSGTVLFAAASAGVPALGIEYHALVAQQATHNLAWVGAQAGLAGWAAPSVQQGDCLASPLPERIRGVVANLPFGRMAFVAGDVAPAGDHEAGVHMIMQRMQRHGGGRHVYFCERQLGGAMRQLGYEDVQEVCVCARKRRYMMSGLA